MAKISKIQEAVELFKLLADENRYRTLSLLVRAKRGLSVGDIADKLDMTPSAVSHLLGRFHTESIVAYERDSQDARVATYCLASTPRARRLLKLLAAI